MGQRHFGVAFAAKPIAPKAPLWSLLEASEALDLLSFVFISLDLEKMAVSKMDLEYGIRTITPGSVPWTHGLFMSLVWSLLVGGIACLALCDRSAGGLIGLVFFSHWVLDYVVHEPDLPIFFDASHALGLGLWASGPGLFINLVLEIALIAGGVAVYILWQKRKEA